MKKFKNVRNQKPNVGRHTLQEPFFPWNDEVDLKSTASSQECQVIGVGKRRDGGTRYWCLQHKADATAKYGRPAKACRAWNIPPIRPEESHILDIDKYEGGIALWGAVPAVYDTTRLPMDRGIHVHARTAANPEKETDGTFRAVRIMSERLFKEGILVSELDAIYYMVSSVFKYEMKHVTCSYCGYPHLDKDWFSVHPHRRHLCAGCGKHFQDTERAIGNPILGIRQACGIKNHSSRLSNKKLDLKQVDFPFGIQIWGSNPAFLWTSDRTEEEGIHVHAFGKREDHPDHDDTYSEVTIDGVELDPAMVRVLMAQSALPSLKNRVLPINCPFCQKDHFSLGELAFTSVTKHTCRHCGREFVARGRFRKTVANPLSGILLRLAEKAVRRPQQHDLNLMPETL